VARPVDTGAYDQRADGIHVFRVGWRSLAAMRYPGYCLLRHRITAPLPSAPTDTRRRRTASPRAAMGCRTANRLSSAYARANWVRRTRTHARWMARERNEHGPQRREEYGPTNRRRPERPREEGEGRLRGMAPMTRRHPASQSLSADCGRAASTRLGRQQRSKFHPASFDGTRQPSGLR